MDKLFCPASWIILAAVMIIIEIITLGLSSIWFAAGAIGSAITAAFDGPEWLQVVVFVVVSTVFLLLLKPLAKKKLNVKVHAFSESAKSKIEAAGGTIEVI